MKKKTGIIVSSVAAIAVCTSMIAGSTFALFTSESKVDISVSSAKVDVVATIDKTYNNNVGYLVSSTLGEALVEPSFTEDDDLELVNLAVGDSVTVKVDVTNYSSVAIMYKASVNIEDENGGSLSQYLEYSVSPEDGVPHDGVWRRLEAAKSKDGDTVGSVYVTVTLPDSETVNDVQLNKCKVSFCVEAVQGNASVSERAVSTAEDLKTALQAGGKVILEKDIEFESGLKGVYITKDTVLDLNGHDLNGDIRVNEPVTLTINGEGNVGAPYGTGFSSQNIFAANKDAKIIVNGGTYVSPGGSAVYANPGQIEINGGSFGFSDEFLADADALYKAYKADGNFDNAVTTDNAWLDAMKAQIKDGRYDSYYKSPDKFLATVINGQNDLLKAGTAKITIKGGTFKRYNPAWGDDNVKTGNGKFLADGYTVEESTDADGNTWYTVVEAPRIADNAEFAQAIADCEDGATLYLGEGTFALPTDNTMQNKTVTIVGSDKETTIINRTTTGQSTGGMVLTVKNATIIGLNENYGGYQHDKSETYIDCVINDQVVLYAETIKFENCVFNQTDSSRYNVRTYGTQEVTFEKCVFNTARKAILVYNENGAETKANFNNCEFNSKWEGDPGEKKAAVEVHTEMFKDTGKKFTVNLNNCTYTENTFTALVADNYPEYGCSDITVDGQKLA